MPAAEVDLDAGLVRRLLRSQFPDLLEGDPAVEPLAFGWDNGVFRLGDDLVVRLPRRALGAELVEHEQRWLPSLAVGLPLPVPAPVRCGRPDEDVGYPWAWSVCPWLPGDIAARTPPDDLADAAARLAGFLRALHEPAPPEAPANPYRGVPLVARDEVTRTRVERLDGSLLSAPVVLAAWEAALEVPVHEGPVRWLHGDLHPANLLVDRGRVSAVIDFGDLTGGDPATDLAVAWMLLDPPAREVFRSAVGADDATWARSQGWALSLAVAYLDASADHPIVAGIGRRTLAAVLADG
jgi:aminoglycoside phosphotransferase (APT) family kinase protein